MAEVVGFHIERMIPELEQMKRLKLFKPEEISEIIKRRKEYEYKIERTMKEKQDFLMYINYEVKLIREIKLRRDKFGISEKKEEIEYSVTKRVANLYKMSLSYFKFDTKLWMSYINFCTQTRFVNTVSEAFKQMLQVHGDKVHFWKYAAMWELEEMNNIDAALNVLKTGLHSHADSKELHTEAFKLELVSGARKGKQSNTDEEDTLSRQEKSALRAEVHFKSAVKSIDDDIEFIISLLEVATEFDFTDKLQNAIIKHMTTNYWNNELMWHTMAQRELKGHHYDKNSEHKSRIQLCVSVYKSAVKVLNTNLMWEKFLDTLVDLYLDKKRKLVVKEILDQSLQNAYEGGKLIEKHYLIWAEMYEDSPKQLEILVMATAAIPLSLKLWITRLRYHIIRDEGVEVDTVSREAINSLKEKSLPIYKSLILYYSSKQNTFQEVKSIYEVGIAQAAEISLELRPQYIEWLVLIKNLKLARQEYEKICRMTPYCLELHKKMIYLEHGKTGSLCLNAIRNVYKLACQQFGKENSDVWVDFIKFEMSYGDARIISDVYNLAKNTLNENVMGKFTTEFALLNTY